MRRFAPFLATTLAAAALAAAGCAVVLTSGPDAVSPGAGGTAPRTVAPGPPGLFARTLSAFPP
ncbi:MULTISPECIES: hypothetical protein [unclassified Streptomyces]|uniref:hypothetical protein n=1 Tax=unclassified Streptomyces TaxID=2593676 RepID=UPI000360332B|nr:MULTISPECIES: hypothetical protein [unclassified Streptomyces]MYT27714.1 hypothetical protein [Streptomyces sp. SID8354]